MNKFVVSLLGALIFILDCKNDEVVPRPENLLSEENYLNLLIELQLLDALVYTSEDELNSDSLIAEVYKLYNTNLEIFSTSHLYYQSKPDEQAVRIDSALKIIEREQKRLSQLEEGSD